MKLTFILTVFLLCNGLTSINAQRSTIRRNIERNMEQKYGEEQRAKGREEIKKVTYENDTRYKDPENKIQATLTFETSELNKKGEVKNKMKDKIVFGKIGECIVMQEGDKNEMWFIYNYADKANYMVNVKDKTAMKMPLINMKKMVEKMARKEAERMQKGDGATWTATEEYQTINGYSCRKFVYTDSSQPDAATIDAWVSNDIHLDLNDNYMFGARLNAYRFPDQPEYKDMVNGFIVRTITYDKKGNREMQRDLVAFEKSADERYFDMSVFKVNDILSGL